MHPKTALAQWRHKMSDILTSIQMMIPYVTGYTSTLDCRHRLREETLETFFNPTGQQSDYSEKRGT